jgi:hypothetical protein
MTSVRQFCSEFDLPDVSPLIDGGLPDKERHAVVWSVMQQTLSAALQVDFLRALCDSGTSQKLAMFAALLTPTMDHVQRDSFFQLIITEQGVEFDKSVVAFGRTHKLGGIVTFTQKHGLESVVSGIKASFSVADERLQTALDQLEFEANPDKLVRALVHEMEDHERIFKSKMALLERDIQRLMHEQRGLERQLSGASPETPPAARGPPAKRGKRGGAH